MKQEVIDIITKYLESAVRNGRLVTSYIPGLSAEDCYDRIAPLREFPEDAAYEAVKRAYFIGRGHCGVPGPDTRIISEEVEVLKRLWEGQPKGTCQTCGGSQWKGIRLEDLVPCPDCEEERRSGEERRVWQRRKRDVGRREIDRSDSHIDRRTRTRRKAVSDESTESPQPPS